MAVEELKVAITWAPVLDMYDAWQPLTLHTELPTYGLGLSCTKGRLRRKMFCHTVAGCFSQQGQDIWLWNWNPFPRFGGLTIISNNCLRGSSHWWQINTLSANWNSWRMFATKLLVWWWRYRNLIKPSCTSSERPTWSQIASTIILSLCRLGTHMGTMMPSYSCWPLGQAWPGRKMKISPFRPSRRPSRTTQCIHPTSITR